MQDKTSEKSKSTALNKAAEIIKKGGVVIFPTDTVCGIGCKFDDKEAIERIKKIKNSNQNFPVLVSNLSEAKKIVMLNQGAEKLVNKFWPGGLTILAESKNGSKIGVRMPDSKVVQQLIKKVGKPIVGTSANYHGQPAPRSRLDLDQSFASQVDLVIPGTCESKMESTVVDTTTTPFKILRQGAVRLDDFKN